jgi:hypothetical protein
VKVASQTDARVAGSEGARKQAGALRSIAPIETFGRQPCATFAYHAPIIRQPRTPAMTLTALLHELFASYAQAASGNAPEEAFLAR